MRKLLLFSIVVSYTTFLHAWGPPDYSLTMTGDSKTVTVSTTPATPTQILTRDSNVQRTWIVFNSSFTIYFSTISTNLSTSTTNGSFSIAGPVSANLEPVIWSPDGVNSPFNGPLFAIAGNTQVPPQISIFRSK